jgi:hypothetical protein
MENASPKHPRVSKNVQRGVEVVLTVIWLGGTSFLLEVVHTGWWGPVVLLVLVVLLEVAFVVWNEGHLPGPRRPPKRSPRRGSTRRTLIGMCVRHSSPGDRERPGPYCPVAALNLATSSAGTRPRSLTAMPCALAHSRTSVLSTPPDGALPLPRAGRRAPPPARRAART